MTIAQQVVRLNSEIETRNRATEFAGIAKFIMLSKGMPGEAHAIASQRRANDRVLSVLKEAVTSGSLSDPTWAGNISGYGSVTAGFVDSLRNIGIFDVMFDAMIRVPLRTRVRTVTVAATGSVVAESELKPVSELTLADAALEPFKATCICAFSDELLRSTTADAHALLQRELQSGVVAATDGKLISVISEGSTASTTTSSGDARKDIATLLQAVTTGARSRLFLLTGATIAKTWPFLINSSGSGVFPTATAQGGSIAGIPVLVSDNVAAGTIMLLDATGLAAANDTITLQVANEAAIALDADAPTSLTSLWQNGLAAIKAERWFGIEKLRDDCVAVIEDADYQVTT